MKNSNEIIFYTVGHSNVPFEKFLELIKTVDIDLLVDVRTIPYSKHVPQFNREFLNLKIEDEGIEYTYLGDKIGGKPSEPEYNQNGHIDYEHIGRSKKFHDGMLSLIEIACPRTVIMCSEENPYRCHRHLFNTDNTFSKGNAKLYMSDRTKGLRNPKIEDTQLKLI